MGIHFRCSQCVTTYQSRLRCVTQSSHECKDKHALFAKPLSNSIVLPGTHETAIFNLSDLSMSPQVPFFEIRQVSMPFSLILRRTPYFFQEHMRQRFSTSLTFRCLLRFLSLKFTTSCCRPRGTFRQARAQQS